VHYTHLVAVLDDGHKVLDHNGGTLLREPTLPGNLVEQAAPGAELHDEVELVGVLKDGLERDDAWVAREVLNDLHLAVDDLLAVLGQGLAGELLAAGLGAVDPDGAELALPDHGAELVLALKPLLRAHPRGGLDAAQLPPPRAADASAAAASPTAGGLFFFSSRGLGSRQVRLRASGKDPASEHAPRLGVNNLPGSVPVELGRLGALQGDASLLLDLLTLLPYSAVDCNYNAGCSLTKKKVD
jgi:hypothetical protein